MSEFFCSRCQLRTPGAPVAGTSLCGDCLTAGNPVLTEAAKIEAMSQSAHVGDSPTTSRCGLDGPPVDLDDMSLTLDDAPYLCGVPLTQELLDACCLPNNYVAKEIDLEAFARKRNCGACAVCHEDVIEVNPSWTARMDDKRENPIHESCLREYHFRNTTKAAVCDVQSLRSARDAGPNRTLTLPDGIREARPAYNFRERFEEHELEFGFATHGKLMSFLREHRPEVLAERKHDIPDSVKAVWSEESPIVGKCVDAATIKPPIILDQPAPHPLIKPPADPLGRLNAIRSRFRDIANVIVADRCADGVCWVGVFKGGEIEDAFCFKFNAAKRIHKLMSVNPAATVVIDGVGPGRGLYDELCVLRDGPANQCNTYAEVAGVQFSKEPPTDQEVADALVKGGTNAARALFELPPLSGEELADLERQHREHTLAIKADVETLPRVVLPSEYAEALVRDREAALRFVDEASRLVAKQIENEIMGYGPTSIDQDAPVEVPAK